MSQDVGPEVPAEHPYLHVTWQSVDPVDDFLTRLVTYTPRTPITLLLIAANVLVFVIQAASGVHVLSPTIEQLLQWGANFGPRTISGQWYRLLTCTFVHGGLLHLAFNMWVLHDVGKLVERLLGNWGFLILYLVAGVGGSLATIFWSPFVVSVGASGAIFGVCGGLVGYLVRQRHSMPMSLVKRLRGSLSSFLVFNIAFGLTVPGIDMAAHLGGMLFGFLAALLVARPITEEGARGRWKANLLLLIVAPVALLAITGPLSRRVQGQIDARMQQGQQASAAVIDALDRISAQERMIVQRYNAAFARYRRHDLTDQAFVSYVAKEILPEWQKLQQQLRALRSIEPKAAAFISEFERQYEKQRVLWQSMVDQARGDNAAK